MPSFDATTTADAPVEDVWKLLYDPSRFPEWWDGVETVVPDREDGYTMYPTGYPDFPMPQELQEDPQHSCVRISCLVSDLVFAWTLRPTGPGTEISVHVDIPEPEAHRLASQTEVIRRSLANLAALAQASE